MISHFWFSGLLSLRGGMLVPLQALSRRTYLSKGFEKAFKPSFLRVYQDIVSFFKTFSSENSHFSFKIEHFFLENCLSSMNYFFIPP